MDKVFDFKVNFLKADGELIKGRDSCIRLESGTAESWILTLRLLRNELNDGNRMGRTANLPQQFGLKLTVSGQGLVERIGVIVGQYLAASLLPGEADVCWDMEFDRRKMPPGGWFYFRIKQANSEYAWMGPVWFSEWLVVRKGRLVLKAD